MITDKEFITQERYLSTNQKDDGCFDLEETYKIVVDKWRNGNFNLVLANDTDEVILKFQNNEITEEQREDEIFSVIGGFLERWKKQFNDEHPETPERIIYEYLPTDKQTSEIIKEMIKDFKEYKN